MYDWKKKDSEEKSSGYWAQNSVYAAVLVTEKEK